MEPPWGAAKRGGSSHAVAAAALRGFAFGLGFFLAGVSWIFVSLHDYGGMPTALAAVATLLFCAVLALFPAGAGALFGWLRSGRPVADALLAAGAWTLAEWLRGWVLTGFPWLALGYVHTPPSPLAGLAPLVGVYGLGFVTMLLAALLATAAGQTRRETSGRPGLEVAWRSLGVAVLAVAAVAAAGAALGRVGWTEPQPAAFTVSLLQGNVEQSLKWQPERLTRSLDAYLQLARRHPARLLVLPETALPTTLDGVPQGYLEALAEAAGPGAEVLMGIVTRDNGGRYLNSAVGYGTGAAQRYGKNHLVPFGEFTPPLFAWTLEWLRIPMSDFARGGAEQPPLRLAGEAVAPNICYEDVFGEEIIRALPQATLLVNLSNTAWFGDSLAQPQHLQISRLRALETGRMMLRATNTGMTAVIGANGELLHTLPPFTAGALTAEVRGYTGATPYARLGNWPAVLAALAAVGWLLALGRRATAATTP